MNVEEPQDSPALRRDQRGPASLTKGNLSETDVYGPVNLGNPSEFTMKELATQVYELVNEMRASGEIPAAPSRKRIGNGVVEKQATTEVIKSDGGYFVYKDLPIDDPQQRRPDITRAQTLLGWSE